MGHTYSCHTFLRGLGTDYADGLGATGSAGSLELTPKVLIAITARPQS